MSKQNDYGCSLGEEQRYVVGQNAAINGIDAMREPGIR
jgi:hypothetical protein